MSEGKVGSSGGSTLTEVLMPAGGPTVHLIHWRVADGHHVEVGTILFEAETEKATLEWPSPAAGVLRQLVPDGAEVDPYSVVGQILQ